MKCSAWFGLLLGSLLLPGVSLALDPPQPASSAQNEKNGKSAPGTAAAPREIGWDDLLPESERFAPLAPSQRVQPLFDDESGPAAEQEGSAQVNDKLDGQTIRLPGFVVPLDLDKEARVSEFLLVPYFGACIHVPPPPPNQIVHVKMAQPMRLQSMYDPVWVIGKLSTQGVNSQLASAAYSIAGIRTEIYEEP